MVAQWSWDNKVALQQIVPVTSVQRIVVITTSQNIIPVVAVQYIVAVTAGQRVMPPTVTQCFCLRWSSTSSSGTTSCSSPRALSISSSTRSPARAPLDMGILYHVDEVIRVRRPAKQRPSRTAVRCHGASTAGPEGVVWRLAVAEASYATAEEGADA